MSAAHLHAVPGPDHASASLPAVVETEPEEEAAVVELLDAVPAPAAPAEAGEDQAAEAGDELEDQEDAEPAEELDDDAEEPGEDVPRRALVMPNLRPYVTANRGAAKELGSLVVEVKRGTAVRVAWKVLRGGGIVIFLVVRSWFSGELAPKVPPVWRFILGPLVAVYAVVQTVVLYRWAPLVAVPAWPLLFVIAQRWATGKGDQAAKAKATTKDSGKSGKDSAKASPKTFAARLAAALTQPSAEASEKTPAKASPEVPAKASPEAPAEPSPETAEGSPATPGQEAGEQLEETPLLEAPAPPSRDDIVRALHALVGESSGVRHTDLRDRLRYPSTRAVREALEAAGIPSRPGVRAVGGNGAGVHRRNFPPLTPLREETPGPGVVAGQDANNNNANSVNAPQKGVRVDGTYWPPGRPYHFAPHPENPDRTVIVRHADSP